MNNSTLLHDLSIWLSQSKRLGTDRNHGNNSGNVVVHPISGDAGHRQYFRIDNNPDLLAVFAPPALLDSQLFVDIAQCLREEGIHAPQVFEFDRERGFLLIESFGEELYLTALNSDSVDSLYGEALLTLLRMQQTPYNDKLLSLYDAAKLRQEMELFPQWFVERLLGHVLSNSEKKLINKVFDTLINSASEQPVVFVHRDYHSRNLIHRRVGPPGVIDFQDAVWGPITYDLVSLLKDCYVRWPQERVNRWAQAYGAMITSAGLMKLVSTQQFQHWFDWMGLQRHIKVLGIFARLSLRDDKSAYLHDLPLVIRYILEVAESYPALHDFKHWFVTTLLPLCEQQSWYLDYRSAGYCPVAEAGQ
jgi:hypothetical protein